MRLIAAIEIGGNHVSGGIVEIDERRVISSSRTRTPVDSNGTRAEILAAIISCARAISGWTDIWAVAIPGPFDYAKGIGRFRNVGKFDALAGVSMGDAIREALPKVATIAFVNDGDAFLLGEWLCGEANAVDRAAGITLGTGVGSAFLAKGRIVDTGDLVPPEGRVDLLQYQGQPLETVVSRRALIERYSRATGQSLDVRAIAERARLGDGDAAEVISAPFEVLGQVIAPWLTRFGAEMLVVGGGIVGSWDLIGPPLLRGVSHGASSSSPNLVVAPSSLGDDAALVGAAWYTTTGAPEDKGRRPDQVVGPQMRPDA